MKKTTKLCAFLLAFAFSFVTGHSVAEEAQPPAVMEVWTCNYQPGKDLDDVMGARDHYVRQAERAGLTLGPNFVWLPIKTAAPYDLLWFAAHPNLTALATQMDTFAATSEMDSIGPRFDAAIDCSAGLATITPIHTREAPEDDDDSAVIASFACNFKHGRGPGDLPDLHNHIRGTMNALGNDVTPNAMYSMGPITSGPNTADQYFFSVYNNASAWAKWVNTLLPSDAGQSVVRHFGMLFDCDQSIWSGQQVISGPAQE